MAKKVKTRFVWAIAHIHSDFLHRAKSELRSYGYHKMGIECYIPTVKVHKKKFKGKNRFAIVPMLFNYGFFKIPYDYACNPDFLMELRSRISCIYGWAKDPLMKSPREVKLTQVDKPGISEPKKRKDMMNDKDLSVIYEKSLHCAVAQQDEVDRLKELEEKFDIFSKKDIDRISVGDSIVLKGYPFEDMPAKVLEINKKSKYVKVSLDIEGIPKIIQIQFENIFYTIYNGYDPSMLPNMISFEDMSINDKKKILN